MKDEKILRFSAGEIVLHWANAILYLTLACTGTLILLLKIFEIEIVSYDVLSLIHRFSGISLIITLILTFILSIFVKSFRRLWNSLVQCLTWKISDIVWLIKVPLTMVCRQVIVPPAERFNAGQKLHLLVVFTILIGFSISGLGIMLLPGALAAWMIHLACFIPAAGFLLLHMFLSMVNPSTRKSLPAIFTGYVSAEYARLHHPLWIKSDEIKPHGSYVSWPALALTTAVASVLLASTLYYYGPQRARQKIQKLISQRGTTAILPGPLVASHANDPQIRHCTACHNYFSSPACETCLSCHKIIEQRMEDRSGFHGKLPGQCRSCHQDHTGTDGDIRNFDTSKFDHNLANYKLQGRHIGLSCQECHLVKVDENIKTQTKYIGLNFEKCTDCHYDPHDGQFKKSCDKCHNEHGWKNQPPSEYHAMDSSYPLLGQHAKVKCEQCHRIPANKTKLAEANFVSLQKNCKQCHKDPHDGQVSTECQKCHTEEGWKGKALLFSHDKHSEFALDNIHAKSECSHCHQIGSKTVYRPLPKTCEGCHKHIEELILGNAGYVTAKPDPHSGRVSCVQCHPTDKQKQKPSEYADKCKSCHNDDYERLYQNWTKAFDLRKSQADELLSKLRKTDPVKADQMAELITQAEHAEFHNIQLTRQLWHNILSQER